MGAIGGKEFVQVTTDDVVNTCLDRTMSCCRYYLLIRALQQQAIATARFHFVRFKLKAKF